jgi:CheY-like chemotaxis protein
MARILIVDDDPRNRELLVMLAEHRGHEALEASDGAEGLRIVRRWRPDLIVADLQMPAMDGPEFVRRLRADPALASIQVAFYTASYDLPETRTLAVAAGVTRILGKPADPAQILLLFDETVGRLPS